MAAHTAALKLPLELCLDDEAMARREPEAEAAAEKKLLDILLPTPPGRSPSRSSSVESLIKY